MSTALLLKALKFEQKKEDVVKPSHKLLRGKSTDSNGNVPNGNEDKKDEEDSEEEAVPDG